MGQHFPVIVQVALFMACVAIIALAAVSFRLMLQIEKQCDRVATAVERFEVELIPLTRNTRVAVDQLSELTGNVQLMVDAAGGLLLPPIRTFNRATRLVRSGAAAFLQALWT